MKLFNFFPCLWVIFALLDPDPGTPLNPDPDPQHWVQQQQQSPKKWPTSRFLIAGRRGTAGGTVWGGRDVSLPRLLLGGPLDGAGRSRRLLLAHQQRVKLGVFVSGLGGRRRRGVCLRKKQCCGIVTIFYGSGSNFGKVKVPVPTFKKLRFRLRI